MLFHKYIVLLLLYVCSVVMNVDFVEDYDKGVGGGRMMIMMRFAQLIARIEDILIKKL